MKKVLIIDDSWLARMSISKMLAGKYTLLEAEDAQKAWAILEKDKIDLIILDILMPRISGIQVLQRLRETGNTIPVIVISADVQETTRKKVLDLGANGFLNKPPDINSLLQKIRTLIE